jgi:hypothetical protein
MPLARILTRFPEQAGALSKELRQRGYTVEFSNPELAGKAPADLEIDFEICAEPDALNRASELAGRLHADVAISPGVHYTGNEASEPETNAAPESLAAEQVAPPEQRPIAAQEAIRESDAFIAEALTPNVTEPEMHGPEPVSAGDMAAGRFDEPSENAFQQAAAATPFDDELEIARAAEEDKEAFEHRAEAAKAPDNSITSSEKAREFAADAGKRSAAALERAALVSGELWSSARNAAQDFWEAARQRAQEYQERAEILRAERRAERQEKLLGLEKRRALAEERAAELEAAREAAAARLQELLRERGALTQAQPAPPEASARSADSSANARVFVGKILARKLRLPFATRVGFGFANNYRPQFEAVLMGVVAACLLFVIGLAVASFHARPAISTSLNQPSSGVTVQGGGVTVTAGTHAVPQQTSSAAQPLTVARTQAAAKPAPAVRQRSSESDVTVRNLSTAKARPRRATSSDRVSDDVTIRHFGAQASAPAQTAPREQLKHYSDLDN